MVLHPRNGISLCAGGGGLELGLLLAEPGFACRCFVEADAHAQAVLVGNQLGWEWSREMAASPAFGGVPVGDLPFSLDPTGRRAGPFHKAALWSDVRTFVGDEWRGHIDLVSAGYPCQPFSAAGKRAGSDDPRHLWPDVARIWAETGAEWGFFENVAGHISLGLETVLRDIWDMGATPSVGLFSSAETGNTHERQRVFILAHREGADRRGKLQSGSARGGWTGPARGDRELAHPNGGNPGAEREQPGGKFGFQPSSGNAGGPPLDDAGRAERRAGDAQGNIGNGSAAGRVESAGGAEQSSRDMGDAAGFGRREGRTQSVVWGGREAVGGTGRDVDHPTSPRCDAEGQWTGANVEGGQRLSSAGCSDMADASQQGSQGQQPSGADAQGREVEAGLAGLRSRAGLCPPSPNDRGAWSAVLHLSPDLAPSLAFRDLVSRAQDLAAMVAEGGLAEAQAERHLRRMADALAQRPRSLRMYGNGVDPLVAGYAWRTLSAAHGLRPLDMEATG